jgi:phosphoribosylanthranilate isomerase
VTPERAAQVVASQPPFVTVVALFVNETAENILRLLARVPTDLIQFHGDESAVFCEQFRRPWMKALRVQSDTDLPAYCKQYPSARAILLDSWQDGVPGGTGRTFDWALAQRKLARPIVLAGGLDENNVGAAIRQLRPAGVDVSGGVEAAPGRKDGGKIARFIAAVRAADAASTGVGNDH